MANLKAKCTSLVQGRMMRVTKVDACGYPVEGDDSVVVSDGFVSIAYTPNIDEGEEISQKNAAGRYCVRVPAQPSFLGYTIEAVFCNVDPDLFALMTGQRVLVDDAGAADGMAMNSSINASDHYFAIEVWAGAPSAAGCEGGGDGTFGYILLPFVQGGVIGDFTVENGAINFTVSNASTKSGNGWGNGPYLVVEDSAGQPDFLPAPLDADDHLVLKVTPVAPPVAECGARPFLDPAGADITTVNTDDTLLSVEFEVAATGTDPYWIDFGDGTWDYSPNGADITHVYPAAGTYTFTVYRGTDVFTDTVTVAAS